MYTVWGQGENCFRNLPPLDWVSVDQGLVRLSNLLCFFFPLFDCFRCTVASFSLVPFLKANIELWLEWAPAARKHYHHAFSVLRRMPHNTGVGFSGHCSRRWILVDCEPSVLFSSPTLACTQKGEKFTDVARHFNIWSGQTLSFF